jgi:hypothetical protein
MNYKEMIMELLENIKDDWILKQIYLVIVNITKEGD